jgi:hypothetical protein
MKAMRLARALKEPQEKLDITGEPSEYSERMLSLPVPSMFSIHHFSRHLHFVDIEGNAAFIITELIFLFNLDIG